MHVGVSDMKKSSCFLFDKSGRQFLFCFTGILIFLFCPAGITALEWESCGLDNKDIYTISIDPQNNDIVYAGSSDGCFKSQNRGATWDTLLHNISVFDMIIHPDSSNILYASLGGVIHKSADGGMNWVKADSGLYNLEAIVQTIGLNPKYPDTLYAATNGTFGGSFYMSHNGGLSWIDVARLDSIGIDAGRLRGGVNEIIIDSESANIVYLGTHWNGDVLESTDFGRTWRFTGLKDQTSILSLLMDPQNHEIIYASSSYGFFRTTNSGTSWVNLNEAFEKPFRVGDMIFNPDKPSELYILSR